MNRLGELHPFVFMGMTYACLQALCIFWVWPDIPVHAVYYATSSKPSGYMRLYEKPHKKDATQEPHCGLDIEKLCQEGFFLTFSPGTGSPSELEKTPSLVC